MNKILFGIFFLIMLSASFAAEETRTAPPGWPDRLTINSDLPFLVRQTNAPAAPAPAPAAPAVAQPPADKQPSSQPSVAPVTISAPPASFLPEATPQLEASVQASKSFQIRIYGYIKLDAAYDTQRVQTGDIIYYVFPKIGGTSDNEFNMTAKQTRLDLDIVSPDIGETKINGRLEVDFYGPSGTANSPNLRLRLAYVDVANEDIGSLRAGQDWDTFITVLPRMNNISLLSDAGALGIRRPQLRLSKDLKFSKYTKIVASAAAARTIGADLDNGGQEDGVDAGFPSAQYNLCLETKLLTEKATKVSVSGHWGMETVDMISTNGTTIEISKNWYSSYSVIGSLVLPIMSRLSLQGTIWQGQDLVSYYGAIGQGINTKLDTAIAAQGGWAQILIDLTQRLNWNLGCGLDAPNQSDLNANDRSRNETLFTTLFYTIKPITFALEYFNMTTSYKNAASATDHRVQASVIFTF